MIFKFVSTEKESVDKDGARLKGETPAEEGRWRYCTVSHDAEEDTTSRSINVDVSAFLFRSAFPIFGTEIIVACRPYAL